MKDLLSKFHSFSNKRMKGNGLGDLKRFSCEALQHEYSSQFLSVDSTRSEDVFQTWVPQVLLIPRPWKISWRAGKPTVTLDITVTKAADYDNGKGKTFCSRSPEIFLSLFSSFTGSNQTRRLKISFTNDIDNIFTERQQGRQHFDNTKMTRDSKT